MKVPSCSFRRKNSKQGLALSTSMAICIVLAILVAVLVSMATLNITTTQSTVSQREAYITAKSALAFAESYYSQHDIPGKDDANGGAALIVFDDYAVAHGAKVYVTKDTSVTGEVDTESLKQNCKKVYVEVLKVGEVLDLTAHCKYDDGNYYELSKEFPLGASTEIRPNSFTGNVSYEAKSDTRYLRIHVRTNPAFIESPYLWTWYNMANPNNSSAELGRSSLVNKLAYDNKYPSDHNGGTWDSSGIGGNCAMQYEGNGWYLTTITFSTEQNVHFVNAIVARNHAKRTQGNDAQSWELFGLPVPDVTKTGEANGIDVYITLNRKQLLDARYENGGADTNDESSGGHSNYDMFSYYYQSKCGSNVKEFAKFCGSWYTVYTKNNVSTLHYRKQGNYSNSGAPSTNSLYEGYGWFRITSRNLDAEYAGYHFYDAAIVSQNEYGQEQVREGFICEFKDGTKGIFATEAEANEAFAIAGETKAGDYLTVNVKGAQQPVNEKVKTTISYETKWEKDEDPADPADPDDPDDPDADPITYNPNKDKPEVKPLASDSFHTEYAVIGSPFNNWGRPANATDDDGNIHSYSYLHDHVMYMDGDNTYKLRVEHCSPGIYEFKVIEMLYDSGLISDHDHGRDGWSKSYGNGSGNSSFEVLTNDATILITFDAASKTTSTQVINEDIDSTQTYAVIGTLNEWGTIPQNGETGKYSESRFEGTNQMTYDDAAKAYVYTTNSSQIVESGKVYDFKIIKTTNLSGVINDDHWKESFGADRKKGSGANNIQFVPPHVDGISVTYNVKFSFNPNTLDINIQYIPTGVSGESFYLIGSNNNWAANKTYGRATSSLYQFEETGATDANGRFIYKYTTPDRIDANVLSEFKVISNESLKDDADPDTEDSIKFEHSWGAPDSENKTYGLKNADGSDRLGLQFTLDKTTKVEFTFYYDPNNIFSSALTYIPVNTVDVRSITIKFFNGKSKDENNHDTDFTQWENLYLTYTKAGATPKCVPVTIEDIGHKVINVSVPEDAVSFYFSNMNSIYERNNPGYQCTKAIEFKKGFAGKTFRPTHYVEDATSNAPDGKLWLITSESSKELDAIEGSGEMVYSGGSGHCNYYNAPLVMVLKMLANKNGSSDGNFAFAARPYSDYDLPDGTTVHFIDDEEHTIYYQGEPYYWASGYTYKGKSFLIVQSSKDSSGHHHTGYLLENEMALIDHGDIKHIPKTRMENRGGASFPSDKTYYNGENAYYNFDEYTPSWYTFKIPVTTECKIKEIKGVVDTDHVVISSDSYFTPANATENYKQALYVSEEYAKSNDVNSNEQVQRFFTYDIDVGRVDTSRDDKVSVYFANNGSGDAHFEKVGCYAYDPLGNFKDDPNLKQDSTDLDHHYYQFTYDTGKYCYFVFYDSSEGDYTSATKKTGILYLTGKEDPDTREYDILALNGESTTFVPYIHPRTQALLASLSIESAARAAHIPVRYTYDAANKKYDVAKSGSTELYYDMNLLLAEASSAKNYYESGSGGGWKASNPKQYMDLADAVQEFIRTITNCRIYIADDPESASPNPDRIFKEASYRDNAFKYQDRWVNLLDAEYRRAVSVFTDGNSNQKSASFFRQCTANINALISAPMLDWNSTAVQIIVDDQIKKKDKDGNVLNPPEGGWGSSNIHLYNKTTSGWVDVKYDLYKTTQSDLGFYAYVFLLSTESNEFAIGKVPPDNSADGFTVNEGKRYIFHTADNSIDSDDSMLVYKIPDNEIKEGEVSESYNWFDLRKGDKKGFTLQFMYDTQVSGRGQDYTVYAGCYTINASYAGYALDLANDPSSETKLGINLFTENAKKFFTNPKNYGMSNSTSNSFSKWSSDISENTNIDIMCSSIGKSSQISAKTAPTKKISFRYKSEKGSDALKLNQNVNFEGGTVTIAVNSIDLSKYDVLIKAKTVIFLTDTIVKTTANGTRTIPHGTYSLNETDTGESFKISLQSTGGDPDWREHYTLISDAPSKLRGGKYITHG